MVVQSIGKTSFNMKEAADFSFLSRYGEVFWAFSQNDSGNISFGANDGKNKYFIKVAGAKTAESCGQEKEAVDILKKAMPLYEALKYPSLIELVEHYMFGTLYVAVFKWAEGECLFDHWNFEKYANNPGLQSPKIRFLNLPVEKKIKSIGVVFDFLVSVEKNNYVAVDFYDGSIMYNFDNDVMTICDIDLFRTKPAFNDIGLNYWGTKRLKAPEEYVYGAEIDSATNIYTLGALVFHFFGRYTDNDIKEMYKNNAFYPCTFENWELNEGLYNVALKAVEKEKQNRYHSLSDFSVAWNNGLSPK